MALEYAKNPVNRFRSCRDVGKLDETDADTEVLVTCVRSCSSSCTHPVTADFICIAPVLAKTYVHLHSILLLVAVH